MAKLGGVAQAKYYNLSAGKSLPEWLSDRKKRSLQKNDIDVRKRIELIQDFEMPGVSDCVQMSRDGQYILATGVYKPRVRCYDVSQLSMKFERCFDSEVVKFEILSDDYGKIAFLQCDRYLEFHVQGGRYYRMRIPKFGRDLAYHYPSCDLFVVGASNQIFRLNLEQGLFLNPFVTKAVGLNVCSINPMHHLLMCGTVEGRIEAWDPRSRHRVGTLDCAFHCITPETNIAAFPSVTALAFRDGLTMGVGTATGQVLLYDIRSNKPFLVKDHLYDLPVKNIAFHPESEMVVSMDSKIIRVWDCNTGKACTSIEPGVELNDLCLVPNTGMLFVANEDKKILPFYVPSLGVAPRWCAFLDHLTEELEENLTDLTYDDYKFVTTKELEELGLSHLIGSNLLRGYMHGYFIDMRLYHKAKSMVVPFTYEDYRHKKIREKIDEDVSNRVKLQMLPKVNKALAEKLVEVENSAKNKSKDTVLLKDDRFKALFENPEFEINEQSEEYRLIHPVVTKLDKVKKKKQQAFMDQFEKLEDEMEGRRSSEEESYYSSSDDERKWTTEVKRQHKLLKQETRLKRQEEDAEVELETAFYGLKSDGAEVTFNRRSRGNSKTSLGDRLTREDPTSDSNNLKTSHLRNQEMTFVLDKAKKQKDRLKKAQASHEERKQHVRLANRLPGRKAKK